jgi:hypothetical protein
MALTPQAMAFQLVAWRRTVDGRVVLRWHDVAAVLLPAAMAVDHDKHGYHEPRAANARRGGGDGGRGRPSQEMLILLETLKVVSLT